MLSSIHPLGERARANRWGLTAAAYVIGTTLAGAATGALAGTIGLVLGLDDIGPAVRGAVVVVAALAVALVDARHGTHSVLHRQVDERWLRELRGWVYGFGYGVQLGTGLVTIVVTTTVYLTWLLAALTADPAAGALVGTAFGLTRGAVLLAGRHLTDAEHLQRFHRRLDTLRVPVSRCVPAAPVVVAVVAVAAVIA